MVSSRFAVIRKFAGLRRVDGATRRKDFKGNRCRINLRLTSDVGLMLDVIKLATGEPKNVFCEAILQKASAARMAELKAATDETRWQAIVDLARRNQA